MGVLCMYERQRDAEAFRLLKGIVDDLDPGYFTLQDINDVFGVYTSRFGNAEKLGDRGLYKQDTLDCLVEMGCIEPVDETGYSVMPNLLERYLRE